MEVNLVKRAQNSPRSICPTASFEIPTNSENFSWVNMRFLRKNLKAKPSFFCASLPVMPFNLLLPNLDVNQYLGRLKFCLLETSKPGQMLTE